MKGYLLLNQGRLGTEADLANFLEGGRRDRLGRRDGRLILLASPSTVVPGGSRCEGATADGFVSENDTGNDFDSVLAGAVLAEPENDDLRQIQSFANRTARSDPLRLLPLE